MSSRLLPALVALACVAWALPAAAAQLRTEVSSRRVGVGERIVVRLIAVQEDGDETPTQPELEVKGKAEVQGPNVASQQSVRMHNFDVTRESSVIATWWIVPNAEGKLVVGPGRFHVGRQVLRGESIEIEVGAARAGAGRRARDPFDPFSFDPFGGRFPFPEPPVRPGPPEAPERLQLAHAPHPIAFLRVLPSHRKLVVGQPFSVEIWAYGSRGSFREVSPTEPTTADFLSYSVVEHSQEEPPYSTTIDGQPWYVTKLRELILVPLRTGKLTIGGMELVVQGQSYPAKGSRFGTKVESPSVTVEVGEPPLDGRPDGYLLGDVGQFTLQAEVSPRQLRQGDYAQLTVTIAGTGNVPSRVLLPTLPGIEWQEPRVTGGPTVKEGRLRGSRTLQLAFSVKDAGALELGAVTLPYYDPAARAYRVASAPLGRLEVTPAASTSLPSTSLPSTSLPSTSPPSTSVPPAEHSPSAPSPRTTWSEFAPPSEPPSPRRWALLFAPPLLALLGRALEGAWRALARRRERSPGEARTLRATLRGAREAARAGDVPLTIRELERGLYEALERATGLKGRGVLRAHLAAALTDAGLEPQLAERAQVAALELEALRYDSSSTAPDVLAAHLPLLERLLALPRKKAAS